MSKLKILIIEDELIIAEDMKEMLCELGYDVIGVATRCSEAEEILARQVPDIALIDILLSCGDDGIQIAGKIKEEYNIPVVFVTSNTDVMTLNRAKEIQPNGYVVKPFEKEDLFASIEIAISNFIKQNFNKADNEPGNYIYKEYLFVKKKNQFEKVKINNIQWIKSEGNYLEIICINKKKYLIRSTFKDFFNNISSKKFIQVHKSYLVNMEEIDAVRVNELVIKDIVIPVGRMYRESLRNQLNIVF